MAKVEKVALSLDNDSKRILRNLTRAVDRLSRNMVLFKVGDGVKRLVEPAEDPAEDPALDLAYKGGFLSDEEYETIKKYQVPNRCNQPGHCGND